MNGEPKTGSQIKTEAEFTQKIARKVAEEMKIRQWSVEQAVKVCSSDLQHTKEMTQFFYDFVTDVPSGKVAEV